MVENLEIKVGIFSNFIAQKSYDILLSWGLEKSTAVPVNTFLLLVLFVLSIGVIHFVLFKTSRFIVTIFSKKGTKNIFQRLAEYNFYKRTAVWVVVLLCIEANPIIFEHYPKMMNLLFVLTDIVSVVVFIRMLMSVVRAFADKFKEHTSFSQRPIESYIQVVGIILYLFGAIILFSKITGQDVKSFFGVLGAASAILLLMFKDTIMGFVASIQVVANDMVRIGDWVTMPSFGADGNVLEITLTTVKVQNFDKTITMIPTHNLISGSFTNWRGMQEFGGRRMKRSLMIKQSTIRHVREEELENLMKIEGIREYIITRKKEIDEYNLEHNIDKSLAINGRNFTNSGLFRKYAQWYIENHPGVNKEKLIMLRQLQPTEYGLPFEIYLFTNSVNWIPYEQAMGDIMDHLVAAVPYFGLELYEMPTGSDIKNGLKTFPKSEGFN